jgi:O-antigen/teichoic acid export membrane protein
LTSGSEIAKSSVRASTILLAGNLVSNALLLVNAFIVARLLQPTHYGEYSLSLQPSTVFILFLGVGVNTAITRFAAYHISRGELEEARRKTSNCILFLLIVGAFLSVISYLTAPFVGAVVLRHADLIPYIKLASIIVFAQAGYQAGISSLIGYSVLKSSGFTYILQAVVKASLAPALILLGFGVIGAVFAQVAGLLVASIFGVFSIYFLKLRKDGSPSLDLKYFFKDVRAAISFGLPSEIGSNVSNFAGQNYVVIILGILTTTQIVGYFQTALALSALITVITASLSLSLFAGFSTLYGVQGNTRLGFLYVVKYLSYAVAPIIFFLIAASSSSIRLIFGRTYAPAAPLLALVALSNLPLVLGQPLFPSYFNGIGKTRFTLYAYLADAIASFILAPLLGIYFHQIGITFSLLGSNFTSGIAAVYLAKKYLGTVLDYKASFLAVVVSAFCAIPTYFISDLSSTNSSFLIVLATVVAQLIVFFGLYLILAPVLGIVNSDDISRLKSASSGMRYFSRIIIIVLNIESKFVSKRKKAEPRNSQIS